jgi:hypothetical protein
VNENNTVECSSQFRTSSPQITTETRVKVIWDIHLHNICLDAPLRRSVDTPRIKLENGRKLTWRHLSSLLGGWLQYSGEWWRPRCDGVIQPRQEDSPRRSVPRYGGKKSHQWHFRATTTLGSNETYAFSLRYIVLVRGSRPFVIDGCLSSAPRPANMELDTSLSLDQPTALYSTA